MGHVRGHYRALFEIRTDQPGGMNLVQVKQESGVFDFEM